MAAAPSCSFLLSLTITLLLCLQSHLAFSFSFDIQDVEDDDEVYVLDNTVPNFRSRSRFLASNVIKKGTHCNTDYKNICNGVPANNGTALLYCCKTHCRNILGDRNNCGQCGRKCKFGELCCNGTCTNVAYNDNHCGKCNKKCPSGVKCDYGACGYA